MKRYWPQLWLAVIVLAAAYLAVRLSAGITLQSNILALLPREARDVAAQSVEDRIADAFSHRAVFLVGDASPARAVAAARRFSTMLAHSGMIADVTSKISPDVQRRLAAAYFPYRAGLLSLADRARLASGDGKFLVSRAMSELYSPGGFANVRLVGHDPFFLLPSYFLGLPTTESRLSPDGDVLTVRDGAVTYALVSVTLAGDPYALNYQQALESFLSRSFSALREQAPELAVLRAGAVFYAHDGAKEATDETSTIGLASTAGTLALILLVFHGLRPILLGFTAISVGILFAFLGTELIFGQIHAVALLFGVSLIGVSVDYSLQYFCEYFDPEAGDPRDRLRRVLPGIAIGLATTLIGYCTLLLAPFPGLRQVAVFSVIGLIASCLTVALWFPLLDTKAAPSRGGHFLNLAAWHWALWERPRLRNARIAIVALCLFGGMIGLSMLKADDDVRHLQSLSPNLKWQEARIERLTGSSVGTQFLLIRGTSEEALLETEERVSERLTQCERAGALSGFTALADFVPSIARQKENRRLVRQNLIGPYLPSYLREIGFQGSVDTKPSGAFLVPADVPGVGPLSVLSILNVSVAGRPAHVVLLDGVKDSEAIKTSIADIPGVHLMNLADDWSRLFREYRNYAIALIALSAVLMVPVLAWRYGFVRGIRVLVPSLAALALAPPLAALAGVHFTFFNAMALVLVLAVGVDYSVFCSESSGARKPVTTLAIALAALSTILSFGMLALSRVFAVHAFGMTMLIGTALAYLFAPLAGDGAWKEQSRS